MSIECVHGHDHCPICDGVEDAPAMPSEWPKDGQGFTEWWREHGLDHPISKDMKALARVAFYAGDHSATARARKQISAASAAL